uniref:C2H2-type domain-containing protein n=1 Tax=Equus caballus TaxID=9796 RepID=A0A9L0RQS0_HORSE
MPSASTKSRENEERFKCDQCHYACKQKRHTALHKRTQTGEKHLNCGHCDKAFRNVKLLRVRIRQHHGPAFTPSRSRLLEVWKNVYIPEQLGKTRLYWPP